jgi:hypothetical protein
MHAIVYLLSGMFTQASSCLVSPHCSLIFLVYLIFYIYYSKSYIYGSLRHDISVSIPVQYFSQRPWQTAYQATVQVTGICTLDVSPYNPIALVQSTSMSNVWLRILRWLPLLRMVNIFIGISTVVWLPDILLI